MDPQEALARNVHAARNEPFRKTNDSKAHQSVHPEGTKTRRVSMNFESPGGEPVVVSYVHEYPNGETYASIKGIHGLFRLRFEAPDV